MIQIRIRYVDGFRDRHGKRRFYFRRGKGPRTPLAGVPGSAEFDHSYRTALATHAVPASVARTRGAQGTFDHFASLYFASPEYKALKPRTRHVYRLVIDRFLALHGHRPVIGIRREDVKRLMGEKSATPGAANDFLKKLRMLMRFAIDLGWRADDPTLRITTYAERELHTWSEEEIRQFEARWLVGTRERTAFALHLYTGQRRSDVVKMSWADISAGSIAVVQAKTGTKLRIPVHPQLENALAAWPRSHLPILTTMFGKPFSVPGYGNWMADAIEKAGLPSRCVLHGLRKATARRLAESGATEKEIAAVTGHRTLSEVARYTRAADQDD